MRYRAQEKAYLTGLMNNPSEKAELRREACERHALVNEREPCAPSIR